MIQNTKGQMIFDASDLCDLIMQGQNIAAMQEVTVDQSVNIENILLADPVGPVDRLQVVHRVEVVVEHYYDVGRS
jgi:hypothetical protein